MSIDSVNNHDDRHLNPNNDKELLLKRLRRIEGQIKGIQGMVENERYCVDILTQISAAKSAINAVGNMILENHIRGCVKELKLKVLGWKLKNLELLRKLKE